MESENTLPALKVDTWIPIDIGRMLQDTMDLSAEEFGGYMLLLFQYWSKGPLQDDLARLDRIARRKADAPSIAQALLQKYFSIGEDGLFHQRGADRRIAQWTEKRLKAKAKASHAANVRWSKHKAKERQNLDAPSNAQAMPFIGSTSTKANAHPPNPPAAAGGLGSPTRSIGHGSAVSGVQAKENNERKRLGSPQTGRAERGRGSGGKNSKQSIAHSATHGKHTSNTSAGASEIRKEILSYWDGQNPDSPGYQWGLPDDRAVDAFRAAHVDLSIEQFKSLLEARAASEVSPAALPHKWVRSLMQFAAGPLDRYGHPLKLSRQL